MSFDGSGGGDMFEYWRAVARRMHAHFTFFVSGVYLIDWDQSSRYHAPRHTRGRSDIGFAPDASFAAATREQAAAAYDQGNEIGTHFNGHFCAPYAGNVDEWNAADWADELDQFDSLMFTGSSLPFRFDEVVGTRTPCLQGNLHVLYPVLARRGFRYDASQVALLGTWPWREGGIWSVPLLELRFVDHTFRVVSMDYTFLANQTGVPADLEREAYPTLRRAFRTSYGGNRAPPEPTVVRRGPVISASPALLDLLLPLCADGRELVLIEVVERTADLAPRSAELARVRVSAAVRVAAFTSEAPADDLARLATEQQAELLVVSDAALVPAAAACDVALARMPKRPFSAGAPVVAPFGGRREEWAALELAAWLAHAHGLPLRLLGAQATGEQRDASRMLANASLALQRFTHVAAESVLVPPGSDAVLAQESSVIVASLPTGELDMSRRRLLDGAEAPVLLVRPGLRPSGVAPDNTLTRFSWSLRDEPG